jgi:hypothetical protein
MRPVLLSLGATPLVCSLAYNFPVLELSVYACVESISKRHLTCQALSARARLSQTLPDPDPEQSNNKFTAVWPHQPPALQLTFRRLPEAIEAPENEQFPLGGARMHVTLTISLQLCYALEKIGLLPHGFCPFLPLDITISSLA